MNNRYIYIYTIQTSLMKKKSLLNKKIFIK